MVKPKAIRDQIITTLVAADPKNEAGVGIKKWFKGEPPASRYPAFPFGWVEWDRGATEPPVGTKTLFKDNFFIVVIDKSVNFEAAEDSIMDFVESTRTALKADATINSLVARSYVSNREKQKHFQGDYSIIAARVTLSTFRRE